MMGWNDITGDKLHGYQSEVTIEAGNQLSEDAVVQFWNLFNAKALMSHHTAFRHFLKDKGMILVLVLVLVGQWIIVTFFPPSQLPVGSPATYTWLVVTGTAVFLAIPFIISFAMDKRNARRTPEA